MENLWPHKDEEEEERAHALDLCWKSGKDDVGAENNEKEEEDPVDDLEAEEDVKDFEIDEAVKDLDGTDPEEMDCDVLERLDDREIDDEVADHPVASQLRDTRRKEQEEEEDHGPEEERIDLAEEKEEDEEETWSLG